ncbi:hypothetical protein CAPTEDRAFT_199961 [Capitella teleta]|uniref:Major facilitator superfamily (MFS) profile domain-containing protein n=1 Tax=Capitella teleta TaxID=283909 RepID=R7U102_CAPTE|nr:hypothetical protein CAPTEDRAFT_199961 [Capitella teleta]|eukprot:ELT97306.1 hypothetical protein CAPTEDRAFT_199961 [Capitella teleta]
MQCNVPIYQHRQSSGWDSQCTGDWNDESFWSAISGMSVNDLLCAIVWKPVKCNSANQFKFSKNSQSSKEICRWKAKGQGHSELSKFQIGSLLPQAAPLSGYARDQYSAKTTRRIVFASGFLICICICAAGWMRSLLGVMLMFGLAAGVLVALTDAPILSLLSRYFLHKRSTANGIAFSVSSIGGLLIPLVIARVIKEYSVRGAMMVLGGLWLNIAVVSAAMIPLPHPKKRTKSLSKTVANGVASSQKTQVKLIDVKKLQGRSEVYNQSWVEEQMGTSKRIQDVFAANVEPRQPKNQLADQVDTVVPSPYSTPVESTTEPCTNSNKCKAFLRGISDYIRFLRTPHLASLIVGCFFASVSHYSLLFLIPPLAVELGWSKIMASNIIAIVSVAELVVRSFIGILADRLGRKKVWITVFSSGCSFICGLVVCLNLSKLSFIAYAPMIGLFGGVFTPLIIPLTMDLVPLEMAGSAAGLFPLITSGGMTVGMPIIGAVFEMTSTYATGFLICVCCNGVTLFFLGVHVIGRFAKCKTSKEHRVEPVL